MSYPIPVDELTLSQMQRMREEAKAAALRRAMNLGLVSSMKELNFGEAKPATDLGAPAGTGYTNETYLTGAAVVNTWTSVYDTALVPQVGNRKILVFYKITVETVPAATSAVRFRLGPTGATTLAWFHLEQFINCKLTPEVWLSEPVVYGPGEAPFIEFFPRVAVPAAGERLGFGCWVAEPLGESVS